MQYIEIIRKCVVEEVFISYNILRSLENESPKRFYLIQYIKINIKA